jgi:two-component system chemotaxis response regulator CheB
MASRSGLAIFTARPNLHLQIALGHVRIIDGPKENLTRPAINPLFRSAAAAYGARVTGVILTGMLDDGTGGLAEIKRKGGVTVVQDPLTALYPSMPLHAISDVDVDYIVELNKMPALLAWLAENERPGSQEVTEPMIRTQTQRETEECPGAAERTGLVYTEPVMFGPHGPHPPVLLCAASASSSIIASSNGS